MRGVIVPPSKLIVNKYLFPQGFFKTRGVIIKGGRLRYTRIPRSSSPSSRRLTGAWPVSSVSRALRLGQMKLTYDITILLY